MQTLPPYQKRGPTIELKNQWGIFRVSVIRSILMRLIYNSKYEEIDKNISDCQKGARRGKGCKSNIWTINGIIHETLKKTSKELRKPQRPTALHVTTRVFKRYNDLRSTSQSTK